MPRFPDHVVFTAKVVIVGFTFGLPTDLSCWALVRVERRYWGLPAWAPDFVILRYYFRRGERGEYFVDGSRPGLKRYLPIVETFVCDHTQPLDRAAVELRLLHDGPPKSGARIIGRVYTEMPKPARGVTVLITGPTGRIRATTDSEGIYDVTGLPSGHYSARVDRDNRPEAPNYEEEADVEPGGVWEATLHADPANYLIINQL